MFAAAASNHISLGSYDLERFKIIDKWWCAQASTVNIGRDRSADGESVSPSLLLTYAPGTAHAAGTSEVCTQDAGPLNARFHLQEPPLLVKAADSVHPAHIQERPAAQELLSAHRVPAPGNRHGSHFRAGSLDGVNNVVKCVRLNLSRYPSSVQPGMDVVELSWMGPCANYVFCCFHGRMVIVFGIYYNTTQKRITFRYQWGMQVILWRFALRTRCRCVS